MNIKLLFTSLFLICSSLALADELDLQSGTSDFYLSARLCERSGQYFNFAANIAIEHFNLSSQDSQRASQLIAGSFGVPAYNPTPNGPNDPGVEGEFKDIMKKLEIRALIIRRKKLLASCNYKPKLYFSNTLSHNDDDSTVSVVGIHYGSPSLNYTCKFKESSGRSNLFKLKKGDKLLIEQLGKKLISGKFIACDERCQSACDA